MESVMPSEIDGTASAPASKSMMQRAVAAAALAEGKSVISNPSFCEDALSSIRCAEAIGAKVTVKGDRVAIAGGGKPVGCALDCGESGLCMRMFSPIAALFGNELSLRAKGSLKKRPAGFMEGPLRLLGASCSTRGGFPPVVVKGPLHGGEITVDCSQSSQFLTGLLMALPLCREDSRVAASGLKSRPYVRMTIGLLEKFGCTVGADRQLGRFGIEGKQRYRHTNYEVEGDWSGASFLLAAGAIAGRASVTGLRADSLQADRKILEALRKAGALVKVSGNAVSAERGDLRAFRFDATDCPDLFPPLAALACYCRGKSRILGAGRLKGKESDRASSLVSELGSMGASIRVKGDAMEIRGGKLRGGKVDPHGDHRIAMACAIAALGSEDGARINKHECVSKSFPGFFEELGRLGA